MQRSLFSYGVAQRTSGLAVQKPNGDVALLEFAYLAENAAEPFKSEWSGNTTQLSQMVHQKFVLTDFNGARPTVFTGSSNMAQGENGDHLIRIEDRKIAIAYAIEALKLFDHFHFRVRAKATDAPTTLRLQKPLLQGRSRGSTSTTGPATSRSATASSSPAEAALQRARSAAWPPGSFTERHGSRRYG